MSFVLPESLRNLKNESLPPYIGLLSARLQSNGRRVVRLLWTRSATRPRDIGVYMRRLRSATPYAVQLDLPQILLWNPLIN